MAEYAADDRSERQQVLQQQVEKNKPALNIPKKAAVMVPPKDLSIKPLPKAEPPIDLQKRELFFARLVALALGLPPSHAMQGASGFGASSGGTGRATWHESPEVFSRALTETCLRINRALEGLLELAYHKIYGAVYDVAHGRGDGTHRRMPTFTIPAAPTLPMEQLLPLFDAQLLDDSSYSHILEVALGFPMNRGTANAARKDRHNAANILPFKDKKDAPSAR